MADFLQRTETVRISLFYPQGREACSQNISRKSEKAERRRWKAALKRDLVAGLEKGLQVIEAFDQALAPDHRRVAQLTGLTRAAARRYLITLTHLGYMRHDNKTFR
jgi:response regulator of citrate/malate metabolism